MMMKMAMVARWLRAWGRGCGCKCECLWSDAIRPPAHFSHALAGYGYGTRININIIVAACAITCDINDRVRGEAGREEREAHVHHLAMFINCHLEQRLWQCLTLSPVSPTNLYLCILYYVSCILYLRCVCSSADSFYLHFALECSVTPPLFTSTALRRFIFVAVRYTCIYTRMYR